MRGLNEKERKNALNEIRILASLNHPQIIGYKEAFYDNVTCSLCIIMEYAEGGDLQSLINKTKKDKDHISEQDLWRYFIQMINGIKYLHEMNIVHRDLKVSSDDYEISAENMNKFVQTFLFFFHFFAFHLTF